MQESCHAGCSVGTQGLGLTGSSMNSEGGVYFPINMQSCCCRMWQQKSLFIDWLGQCQEVCCSGSDLHLSVLTTSTETSSDVTQDHSDVTSNHGDVTQDHGDVTQNHSDVRVISSRITGISCKITEELICHQLHLWDQLHQAVEGKTDSLWMHFQTN